MDTRKTSSVKNCNDDIKIPSWCNNAYYEYKRKQAKKAQNRLFAKRVILALIALIVFYKACYFIGYYVLPKIVEWIIL